jgi:hypothetical protein
VLAFCYRLLSALVVGGSSRLTLVGSGYTPRLLEEQAAAFGLEKTHINVMQSLVDKLQVRVR